MKENKRSKPPGGINPKLGKIESKNNFAQGLLHSNAELLSLGGTILPDKA